MAARGYTSIDELHDFRLQGLSLDEIARRLQRSRRWVMEALKKPRNA
jgi:predicted transcriptional regulator